MRIVIVGAGPIGLYLAIKLRQMIGHFPHEVVLLDKRVGKYSREGIVANKAASVIETNLGRQLTGIKPANDTGEAVYIKDVEHALYTIAKHTLHIKTINENFESVTGSKIKIKSSLIEGNFILDCTGKRRSVINYINEINHAKKPFTIKQVANNPHKSHFIAQVTFSSDQIPKLRPLTESTIDPTHHALTLYTLREQFGWQNYSEPELTLYPMPEMIDDKKLYILYYEIPDAILQKDKDIKAQWLKALLELKTGNPNIEFTITNREMSFTPLSVDPQHVVETHVNLDGTIVIPQGDSQFDHDYRMGIGIMSGIERANAFLSSLTIDQHNIQFNPELYRVNLGKMLAYETKNIQSDYESKASKIISALDRELNFFEQALSTCIDEKLTLIFQSNIANIYILKSTTQLTKAAASKPVATSKSLPNVRDIESYQQKITIAGNFILLAFQYSRTIDNQLAIQIANSHKDIGNLFFKHNEHKIAFDNYQNTLQLIDLCRPTAETAKIKNATLSNILACLVKAKQHDAAAIKYADEGCLLLQNPVVDSHIATKMANNTAIIYLNLLENTPTMVAQDKKAIIEKIENLITFMKTHARSNDELSALRTLTELATTEFRRSGMMLSQ